MKTNRLWLMQMSEGSKRQKNLFSFGCVSWLVEEIFHGWSLKYFSILVKLARIRTKYVYIIRSEFNRPGISLRVRGRISPIGRTASSASLIDHGQRDPKHNI